MVSAMLVPILLVSLVSANIPDYYKISENTDFSQHEQACPSNIFCYGRLLEAVMAFKLYPDSKTFVDMPMIFAPEIVLSRFNEQFPTDDKLTKEAVKQFVNENFSEEGTELQTCQLDDHKPGKIPPRLLTIKDKKLRDFAMGLHQKWNQLCRNVSIEVQSNPDLYSSIWVPGKFIVPGGRFREIYYWDTYWTILGLLQSDLPLTVKSMLKTFTYLIDEYGFIPNGARRYYMKRSQPPLLTGMFYEYIQATDDRQFLIDNIKYLEKELNFWHTNRTVKFQLNGRPVQLFHYLAASDVPRPESFREDVELVKDLPWSEKNRTWRNLASAAEAGWDFSSRWFADRHNLSTIETTEIVQVDLNAFMCWNYDLMRYFYGYLAEKDESYREKQLEYSLKFDDFRRNFQKFFYVDGEGWYDYNLRTHTHDTEFYASNAVPLFTRCYNKLSHRKIERFYEKLVNQSAFTPRGVPTSRIKTGEQWDYPNSWPPLQHMIIEGMRISESARLQEKAFELARQWVQVNYEEYLRSNKAMWEKYNVEEGRHGSGGEYDVQLGFGWTNSVILDLLVKYGIRMNSSEFPELPPPPINRTITNLNYTRAETVNNKSILQSSANHYSSPTYIGLTFLYILFFNPFRLVG